MNSIFHPNSYRLININGHPYMLHESVLKKMSIFAPIFDESFDQQNINVNIPDYDIKIVNDVFIKLFGQKINNDNRENNIQKLILMMYLGVNIDIVVEYANEISKDELIVSHIINEFIAEKYHDYMNIILHNLKKYIVPNIVTINLEKIKATSYSHTLKINFIKNLVYNSMNIYIYGEISKTYVYVVGYNNAVRYMSGCDHRLIYNEYGISDLAINFETDEIAYDYFKEQKEIKLNICNNIANLLLK